jgi:hypothetical protein
MSALDNFDKWYNLDPAKGIWSHGASFDLPVINSMYDRNGRRTPWKYREERDTRTIFWLIGGAPVVESSDLSRHSAVDDCIYQVRQIQNAVSQLEAMGVDVPIE